MDPIDVFSAKAEKYARYRWGYALEAIQIIVDQTGITEESRIADIGAGTGILTKEFIGTVKKIFAVEPNPEMRAIAARELDHYPSCQVINGRAEATTLDDHSVDLVTAAQAIHWFEPEAARREFHRILKPGGWLAICRNYGTNQDLGEALQDVYPTDPDTETWMVGKRKPRSYYFDGDDFLISVFPFRSQLTWEEFFGSLSTASNAPDEGSSQYAQFEHKARGVFDKFNKDGWFEVQGMTELYLGQISKL